MTAPDYTPKQFTNLLHARGHPYMRHEYASTALAQGETDNYGRMLGAERVW